MENEFIIIGRRIKTLRTNAGVKQVDMAEAIGMSQTNLSNIEGGRTACTIQVLFKIRNVLKCNMADFFVDFDGTVEETPVVKDGRVKKQTIEIEDVLQILKLLKAVDIKGL